LVQNQKADLSTVALVQTKNFQKKGNLKIIKRIRVNSMIRRILVKNFQLLVGFAAICITPRIALLRRTSVKNIKPSVIEMVIALPVRRSNQN